MPRLLDALKNKPNLKVVATKIIADEYKGEIDRKSEETMVSIAKRVNTVINQIWDDCQVMIREEVRKQMPKLPEPKIIESKPVIQVIERVVEKEVQNALRNEEEREEEKEGPIRFVRNSDGFVTHVKKGGKTLTVKRDKKGYITGVE